METEKQEENIQQEGDKARNVTISKYALVKVSYPDGRSSEMRPARDVFSVLECLTSVLVAVKSKADLANTKVTVLSVEDEDKSDPVPEGGKRYSGPYGVGDVSINDMPIADAMSSLTSAVIPAEWGMANFERVAKEMFMRSRMDGVFITATFDGVPATTSLMNSSRPFNPTTALSAYRALKAHADALKAWAVNEFGDKVAQVDWDAPLTKDGIDRLAKEAANEAERRAERLVLPSGERASAAQEGIKTPEEIRKGNTRVVHLY